ncbi:MAG: type II toxin-antitoxin system RelE/ParE family toxin [Nocardiopsaceae bacterium]|nr:type II toxin-antitoxin system RelE/ParE family toxin [Nocardiopsaceae bacterium]
MSLNVVFRETALRTLARIRREDAGFFARTRRAIAMLPEDPRPDGAVPWGTTGIYRLHAGQIRVLYEIDEDAAAIYIINIGRLA